MIIRIKKPFRIFAIDNFSIKTLEKEEEFEVSDLIHYDYRVLSGVGDIFAKECGVYFIVSEMGTYITSEKNWEENVKIVKW